MNRETKNILKNITIAIIAVASFFMFVYIISCPYTDIKEVCVFNQIGDTIYFNSSDNIKVYKFSDSNIQIEDENGTTKFMNAIVKITRK